MNLLSILVLFAAVAGILSLALPHLAPGLGVAMMLIYLGLAALAALIGLFRRS